MQLSNCNSIRSSSANNSDQVIKKTSMFKFECILLHSQYFQTAQEGIPCEVWGSSDLTSLSLPGESGFIRIGVEIGNLYYQ